MQKQIHRLAVVAALVVLAVAVDGKFVHAVSVTWNVAGGGDWDTSTPNWTGGSTFYTDGDAVTFNNSAGGVINLTANRAPLSTTFSAVSGTYTISGSNITSGTFELANGSGGTVVMNSQHTGAVAVLIGTSSTLRLGASERFNNSSTLGAYTHSGTFDMNGFSETVGSQTGSFNILNMGGLTLNGGDRPSGFITGSGALTKNSGGTYYFGRSGGANTYSGGTFINGGFFRIYNANDALPTTGMVSVAPGAVLNLAHYNNTPIQTIGALNGGGNVWTSTDGIAGTVFSVGNGGGSGSFSGIYSGNGSLVKLGAGMQVLDGNNTYTGTTTVSGGTLLVNGITGPNQGNYTVQANATLGGSGTINLAGGNAVTVLNDGILSPGNSAGTLTINGGLNLNNGAILNMELGTGGDTIVVNGVLTGSASAGGITLNLTPINEFGTFVLLDWTGGSISGLELTDFNVVGGAGGELTISGSQLLFTVPLPEPASYTLLALGLMALAGKRRRSRSKCGN